MLSKMGIINDELPKLEELYSKVKEMRFALDNIYSDYTKKLNSK